MRAVLVSALLSLLAACGARAEAPITTEPPKPIPELHFQDLAGNETGLDAFRGEVVVLNLWATWCAPCREEMPSLDRLQAERGGENLEVVALSLDRGESLDKIRQFYDEVGIEHLALYRDPKAAVSRAFRAPGLPTTIVIDAKGREVGRVLGAAEWDGDDAIALLEEVAAE
jgi:thiol-disulfide isomerase/thioredoxin